MLFIKRIETSADFESVKQLDPHAEDHIWVLINNSSDGKSFFAPMVPMDESELEKTLFFFKKSTETIWKGGFYISPGAFDLTFDGTINHQDSPKPLLTTLGVKVLGVDINQDMTELISWLSGKQELHTEEIDANLANRKKIFFSNLEQKLYQPQTENEVHSHVNMNAQIALLAKDCMLKAFPWLNVEISFANTEIVLSESEKEFKKYCEEMAENQRRMTMELQQKQAETAYRVSLQEMEQNEKELLFAANLREQDRLLALEEKDLAMRILKETADDEVQKERERIHAEKEEIRLALDHKKNLLNLEVREKELNMEADAKERQTKQEILEIQKQQEQLKLKQMQDKVEFSQKFREEKMKAAEQGGFFDSSVFNARKEQISQNEAILQKQLDDLRSKMTAVYGDINSRKTVIARQIAQQKRNNAMSLKRDGVSPARAISLMGKVDINTIKVGTILSFKFRSPVSGYFNLFCAESGGGLSVLSPNMIDQQTFVEAGRDYEFPAHTSQLYGQVTQDGPEGYESVYAIVTPRPLTNVPPDLTADAIRLLPSEIEQITNLLETLPANSWAADEITYSIKY